jgi:hypothetical protein
MVKGKITDSTVKRIAEALQAGFAVTYAGVEVTSVKKNKIETKGDGVFFTPWKPALRFEGQASKVL